MKTACPQINDPLRWEREAESFRQWCKERHRVGDGRDHAEWRLWVERAEIRGEQETRV
jgi:hypothetical protein